MDFKESSLEMVIWIPTHYWRWICASQVIISCFDSRDDEAFFSRNHIKRWIRLFQGIIYGDGELISRRHLRLPF